MIGTAPSHTQAARTVNNTTPQQQSPPHSRPSSIISRPVNEISTPSKEPKMILHTQQTVLRNATENLDETERSEQLQPASPAPESTVRARARTPSTSANDLSNFSEHHSGQLQRSAHLQPASPGLESTVRARARTPLTSINDLSSFSEHHSGHPKRSAQLQPAPEQLEPSLSMKTQALSASSDINTRTEPIMNGSTPLNDMKKCESPNTLITTKTVIKKVRIN